MHGSGDPQLQLLASIALVALLAEAPDHGPQVTARLPGSLEDIQAYLQQWDEQVAGVAAALEERQRVAGFRPCLTAAELRQLMLVCQLRLACVLAHHETSGDAVGRYVAAGRAAAHELLRLGSCRSVAFMQLQLGALALDKGQSKPSLMRTGLEAAEREKGERLGLSRLTGQPCMGSCVLHGQLQTLMRG